MNNRTIGTFTLSGVLLIVSLIFTACQKGDESLGRSLIPGNAFVYSRNYEETGTIKAYTFTDEKVRMDHPGFNYVGSFNDPVFGRTDGAFAAQFRLASNPDFDSSAKFDSLILRLTYKRIYGDTATAQTFKVYELTSGLDYDSKYLSTFNLKSLASPTLLGSYSFIPKFRTDSAKTDTTIQYLRIRLSDSLGQRFMKMDSLQMISNEIFLQNFKGLYIEADAAARKGTLIGLTPTGSAMGLYYHTTSKDSLFFGLSVTTNSANVAAFKHDYRGSLFGTHLNQELIQDTLAYLQPTGGTKIKINMPTLEKWKDSTQYTISRATLVFYVDTLMTDARRYEMPERIYLKYMDSTNTEVFPKDSELSSTYYNGIYDATTASYTFNITRHLEQIVKKEVTTTSMYLVATDRSGSANRVVLKGGNSSKPIKLQVKYTRYQ
ncbi:MAG: DUF4270 domain-containing protein [Marinilabiliales bacterium]|nr:DUF4270 domain-containing protein [Marinilabiliales bacterium]